MGNHKILTLGRIHGEPFGEGPSFQRLILNVCFKTYYTQSHDAELLVSEFYLNVQDCFALKSLNLITCRSEIKEWESCIVQMLTVNE